VAIVEPWMNRAQSRVPRAARPTPQTAAPLISHFSCCRRSPDERRQLAICRISAGCWQVSPAEGARIVRATAASVAARTFATPSVGLLAGAEAGVTLHAAKRQLTQIDISFQLVVDENMAVPFFVNQVKDLRSVGGRTPVA